MKTSDRRLRNRCRAYHEFNWKWSKHSSRSPNSLSYP